MLIDIAEIPFSRRGSYFAVSYSSHLKSICLRDVHGGDGSPSELFELFFDDSESSDCQSQVFQDKHIIETTETVCQITEKLDPKKYVRIIFPDMDTCYIEVSGLKLKLKAHKVRYDTLNQLSDTSFEYISYKKETKYLLSFAGNGYQVEAPWYRVGNSFIEINLDGEKGVQELRLLNYCVVAPSHSLMEMESFNEVRLRVASEYEKWKESTLDVPREFEDSRELASYILWSSIVRPIGMLTEEAVYMSKNWMQNIWSWDNCFNAMGIGEAHPELAFKQFKIFCDHQDTSGVYPDFINDQYRSYNCCKPPIHGWAYQNLREKNDYFSETTRLKSIYESVSQSTLFWYKYRWHTEFDLPYYTHGNDSGWDNASIFHEGLPVLAPDLAAYLVQQLDVLASWADELGELSEAKEWRAKSDKLLNSLLKHLHNGDQFIARSSRTGRVINEFSSAILYLPLVIAKRLPDEIVKKMVVDLTTSFEGDYGISTEKKSSPHYQVDGYWLGPIWAPETYVFFDAFKRSGYDIIANRLAEKFCQVAKRGGMAENYNPETGEGNDDLSFTWTSSVFLLLGNFLKEGK